jgi:hypothetical protein
MHWRKKMPTNLSNRVTALELSSAVKKPRWRTVISEVVYADEDETVAKRKSKAAIEADRKATGWPGDYIVMQMFDTHARDGTWIGARRRVA